MRRFIVRFLLVTLVAVVIGFYPLLAPTPHRIDQAHFELIQDGMTKADVEAIFGVPPGRYDWAEPDSLARIQLWMSARLGSAGMVLSRFISTSTTVSPGRPRMDQSSRNSSPLR
jgi:hypothetical protein